MFILGIESTCDESAASVVKDGIEILSQVVASQSDLHHLYGGVVPELACRRHVDVLLPLIEEALSIAKISLNEVDAIAVAKGPGLIGALLIGMSVAKTLALATGKPLVGVSHVEAHLYAAYMEHSDKVLFPALGLVVSGGHTALVYIERPFTYKLIGKTVDDAIGEAFDKVAKLLGLPYPGGPEIERLARLGDNSKYSFKSGVVKGRPYDFSFSGLKTNVLYTIQGKEVNKADIAASFQETALQDVVSKAKRAAAAFGCQSILVGGGVSQNQRLRDLLCEKNIFFPSKMLSLDNAAMIAGLGYPLYMQGAKECFSLEAQTRIPFPA